MTKVGLRKSGGVSVGLSSIAKCKWAGRCVCSRPWLWLGPKQRAASDFLAFGNSETELEIFRMLERPVTLLESPKQ